MQSRSFSHFMIIVTLILLTTGCATLSNFSQAACRQTSSGFEIGLSGMHPNLTHSVTGYLRKPLTEAKIEFHVPRISGIVDGSEIPHSSGTYAYGGTLEFRASQLIVELHSVDTDDQINRPLDWNGTYQLGKCAGSTP
jgi:hypothetical protein